MARVLIGWELGANRGHAERIRLIAARLLADGHDVAVALQQTDALGLERDPRITVWQAPIWPRLLVNAAQDHARPVATMGDILGRLGLDRPGCLASLVRGWDQIFAAARPDVVVADYAPAMLSAAAARIPRIRAGDAFCSPPSDAAAFANLAGHAPAYDESRLLDIADADLVSVGREALSGLPALFAAEATLVSGFAELDPYSQSARRYCAPSVMPPLADGSGGKGEELFVYGLSRFAPGQPFWAALAQLKRPVRIHMPDPTAEHLNLFARYGFCFEAAPQSFPLIAARSVAALSYGGHGFTSACLLAALPHMIVSFDLEKQLFGSRIAALGFGAHRDFYAATPDDLARDLERLAEDHDIASRLRAAAPRFHTRMATSLESEVAAAVTALA